VSRRNQRWFLNMVVEVETDLFPGQRLARISKIDQQLGRRAWLRMGLGP